MRPTLQDLAVVEREIDRKLNEVEDMIGWCERWYEYLKDRGVDTSKVNARSQKRRSVRTVSGGLPGLGKRR